MRHNQTTEESGSTASDAENEGAEAETEEEEEPEVVTELWFVCNKCNGIKFRTVAEKDAHREWHRNERLKRKKPGPASKRRLRGGSPDPSLAGTLFSVREVPRTPIQKKKVSSKKVTDTSPSKKVTDTSPSKKDTDTSAVARKRRAKKSYKKNAKKTKTKENGG